MLSKLVIAAISPLGTSLLLGLVAVLLTLLHRRRLAVLCAVTSLVWLWIWSLPVISDAALRYVEDQHPPVPILQLPTASAIVILGGGVAGTLWPPEMGQPADLGQSSDRVWHGARLFHAGKASMILLVGAQYFGLGISEAEAMELFLLDLGVPQSAIVLEQRSRNTAENARYTAQLLEELGKNDILLVTSATHMERARRHFESQGLKVIPATTDYRSGSLSSRYCCLPDTSALSDSRSVFKELLGQWVSR
ncbi:MAG: YdcF family protein [Halioglobus sp.]